MQKIIIKEMVSLYNYNILAELIPPAFVKQKTSHLITKKGWFFYFSGDILLNSCSADEK